MKKKIILFCFLFVCFFSCEKVTYYPDNQLLYAPTIDIAHRGGRTDSTRENTFEAIINALPYVGGIEIDVQLSKSRTVWLSHDFKVEDCTGPQYCFSQTYDSQIEVITTCNGIDISYTKLEEVLQYMEQNNIRKYISVDLKGWLPCDAGAMDIEGIMKVEAEEIIRIGKKYNLSHFLLFETENISVLNWIKAKDSNVQTYYTSYGDYEKGLLVALDNKFSGISYKSFFNDELDADKIKLLHKKGLRLNAWNIPDSIHANFLREINADFIQIDL